MLLFSGTGVVSDSGIGDNFNRADSSTSLGTSSTGHLWVAQSGVWGISSNQAYLPTPVAESVAYIDAGDPDLPIKVTRSGTDQVFTGISFRVVDSLNFWIWYSNTTTTMQLWKRSGGTWVNLDTASAIAAQFDEIEVVPNGSDIDCYHQGVLKVSVTDGIHATATKHGLYRETGASANVRWDDFSIG